MLRKNRGQAFGGMWVFPGGQGRSGRRARRERARPGAGGRPACRASARRSRRRASSWPATTSCRSRTGCRRRRRPSGSPPGSSSPPCRQDAADVVIDGGEIGDHVWTTPAGALERHRRPRGQPGPAHLGDAHRPGPVRHHGRGPRRCPRRGAAPLRHPLRRRRRHAWSPCGTPTPPTAPSPSTSTPPAPATASTCAATAGSSNAPEASQSRPAPLGPTPRGRNHCPPRPPDPPTGCRSGQAEHGRSRIDPVAALPSGRSAASLIDTWRQAIATTESLYGGHSWRDPPLTSRGAAMLTHGSPRKSPTCLTRLPEGPRCCPIGPSDT